MKYNPVGVGESEVENIILDLNGTLAVTGKARIDIRFKLCNLRIGTLRAEVIHGGILQHTDVLAPSINNALDMLIFPDIFNSTIWK